MLGKPQNPSRVSVVPSKPRVTRKCVCSRLHGRYCWTGQRWSHVIWPRKGDRGLFAGRPMTRPVLGLAINQRLTPERGGSRMDVPSEEARRLTVDIVALTIMGRGWNIARRGSGSDPTVYPASRFAREPVLATEAVRGTTHHPLNPVSDIGAP